MILLNNTSKDKDWLKFYWQQLLNKGLTRKGFANLEMEIKALNHLVYVNGIDFVDPRKPTNTLESTIINTVNVYIVALSWPDQGTHQAVAQGFAHLIESWIKPKFGIELAKIQDLLITPLEKAISSGDNKIAQLGAWHCFYFLIRACFENKYTKLNKYLYGKFLTLFMVKSCQNYKYRKIT